MTSGLGPIPGKNNQFQGEEFGGNQDLKKIAVISKVVDDVNTKFDTINNVTKLKAIHSDTDAKLNVMCDELNAKTKGGNSSSSKKYFPLVHAMELPVDAGDYSTSKVRRYM
jgi:hypothetical protein